MMNRIWAPFNGGANPPVATGVKLEWTQGLLLLLFQEFKVMLMIWFIVCWTSKTYIGAGGPTGIGATGGG